jgi:hypothetical protein
MKPQNFRDYTESVPFVVVVVVVVVVVMGACVLSHAFLVKRQRLRFSVAH